MTTLKLAENRIFAPKNYNLAEVKALIVTKLEKCMPDPDANVSQQNKSIS